MAKWDITKAKCPNCEETFQMYVDANEARLDAEAKLSKCEALLELIQEEWAGAVYGDLENGVASLNAVAATDFYRRYPLVSSFGETLNRIIDGGQEDA